MTLLRSWIWPDVSSRKNALFAITEASWVMVGVACLSALFTFVDLAHSWELDERLLGFAEAALLAGIAFGVRRKSRSAAVAGFALYILDRIGLWAAIGRPGSLTLTILVAAALLHGVRGTFAFHNFAPIPANAPTIEQSFRSFGQEPSVVEKDAGQR